MESITYSFMLRLFRNCALIFVVIIFILRVISDSSLIYDQLIISSILTVLISLYLFKLNRTKLIVCILIVASIQNASSQVLMNVDRSRSLYIFGWAEGGSLRYVQGELNLDKVSSLEKLNRRAIEIRIEEQISRKLMFIDNEGKLKLSLGGQVVFQMAEITSKVFRLTYWRENKS